MRIAKSRSYRMTRRADQVHETRQRIVEATVRLHGTMGPAQTSIAAIADEAGVTRLTVYRHFSDDESLLEACSSHWRATQKLPDIERWKSTPDPEERLRLGLSQLYGFYQGGREMLRLVHRDSEALPPGRSQAQRNEAANQRAVLVQPFRARGARRRRLEAVIGHAISFSTWQSLCSQQGLSTRNAVDLMVVFVLEVARQS